MSQQKNKPVHFNAQLMQPLDAVVFDCDSTLSQMEGINYLAEQNGVAVPVRALTEKAMSETGITPTIYQQRLDLVKPTAKQVADLASAYYDHLSPLVDQVIDVFHHFNKPVFIVSAGIQSAVVGFAQHLAIPAARVFAVDVYFDEQGRYQNYDKNALMANLWGKRKLVEQLKIQYPRIAFFGDGMNDIEAASAVTRFIGYGGVCFRQNIADLCDFYINDLSFAAALPLCLTATETAQLSAAQQKIFHLGLTQIEQQSVLIKS